VDGATLSEPCARCAAKCMKRCGRRCTISAATSSNTVVSAGMKMLNALARIDAGESSAADAVRREGLGILLRLLSPIVPHLTHVLWRSWATARTC